jgi:hypothetical protein
MEAHPSNQPGYGIKCLARDRDALFEPAWNEIVLEIDGVTPVVLKLSPPFCRNCSEVRSPEVGRWLIAAGAAPWKRGCPPGIIVRQVEANLFTARIQTPSSIGQLGTDSHKR